MRTRGFTLMEMLVVVGVAGLLTGLSLVALEGLKERTAYSNAVSLLVADLKTARWRALAEGRTVYAVAMRDPGGNHADRYAVVVDLEGDLDPLAFDFDPPEPLPPERLIADRTFSDRVAFGPPAGFGGPLPAPFAGVPANQPLTFATASTGPGVHSVRAVVTFLPDGSLRLSDELERRMGSLSIVDTALPERQTTIAFIARSGTVHPVSR